MGFSHLNELDVSCQHTYHYRPGTTSNQSMTNGRHILPSTKHCHASDVLTPRPPMTSLVSIDQSVN